jgi:hypothetical protein
VVLKRVREQDCKVKVCVGMKLQGEEWEDLRHMYLFCQFPGVVALWVSLPLQEIL